MEESTNTSPVPSNCTSSVCSDPAHDDLAHNVIKYQSPASVATAIDDMADAIVTKATQKAKEAIENAACDNSQTKQQSALE